MKNLKKNVHAIQVGCEVCEGPHLSKDCPLNKGDVKTEEVKYGESRPFQGYNSNNYRKRTSGYNRPQSDIEQSIQRYFDESAKKQMEWEEWLRSLLE